MRPIDLGEGSLDFGKRALGIAVALRLETAPMLEKLFPIEVGEAAGGVCPRRPLVRQSIGASEIWKQQSGPEASPWKP